MTINNPQLYMAGVWDWIILKECFGMSNIKPSDIDGVVEHNGHTLYFETKQPGVVIPQGQRIMFETWQQQDKNTVMIIWGAQNIVSCLEVLYHTGVSRVYPNATNETLRERVKAWYDYAHANPRSRKRRGQ